MPYWLDHPEHGTHICYTPEDVEEHKKLGWIPREEKPKEAPRETLTLPKKRGRPPKAK